MLFVAVSAASDYTSVPQTQTEASFSCLLARQLHCESKVLTHADTRTAHGSSP